MLMLMLLLMLLLLRLLLLLLLRLVLVIARHRRWCTPIVVVVFLLQFSVSHWEPAERVCSQILTELPALGSVPDQGDSVSFEEAQLILAGRKVCV